MVDVYIPHRLIGDIDEAGYAGDRLIVKSGQERVIVAVVEHVIAERRGPSVPQDAQSLECESRITRVNEQVRVMKLSLESRIRERIGMEHPVWHWLLEWCAQMLNRFRNDAEGRTGVLCLRKGLVVTIEDGKSVW